MNSQCSLTILLDKVALDKPSRIVYRTQLNSAHKKSKAKVKISEKLFLRKNKISPLLKTPEKVFQMFFAQHFV